MRSVLLPGGVLHVELEAFLTVDVLRQAGALASATPHDALLFDFDGARVLEKLGTLVDCWLASMPPRPTAFVRNDLDAHYFRGFALALAGAKPPHVVDTFGFGQRHAALDWCLARASIYRSEAARRRRRRT